MESSSISVFLFKLYIKNVAKKLITKGSNLSGCCVTTKHIKVMLAAPNDNQRLVWMNKHLNNLVFIDLIFMP